jgi:sugar phosphate isomerase/epimerase
MTFGISTHLVHGERLNEHHLGAIAEAGFDRVELFALGSHFDYHSEAAARELGQQLAAAGLRLHSVHAPIVESLDQGVWGPSFSTASTDMRRRTRAIEECRRTLALADAVPYSALVVHVGVPEPYAQPGDNNLDAARHSIEALHEEATARGVRLALEVIPNALSHAEVLATFVEQSLELPDVGICLDTGHAHLLGDVVEAVETVSGQLLTTHVHDNAGRQDDHGLPFEGSINWPAVMMAFEKVGYAGPFMLELAATADLRGTLRQARAASDHLASLAEPPPFDFQAESSEP